MYEEDIIEIENKIANSEKLNKYERKMCAWGEVGKYVDEQEGEEHRWVKDMSTIFDIGGQLYCINWQQGLTEMQENEYFNQPYKVRREEKEVTTTVVSYIAVED